MRWGPPNGKWTSWFAWYPVRLSGDEGRVGQWAWLETVERTRVGWRVGWLGDSHTLYRERGRQ